VLPRHKKLAAVVAGLVLAGVPLLSAQYFLDRRIDTQGQQEVDATARRGMALAESRIAAVIAGLAALGDRGITACGPAEREALDVATFDTMAVKELAVVDPRGETLCTNHALGLAERHVVSRRPVGPSADTFIEVVDVGAPRRRMVRIHRANAAGGNGLAALIHSELLVPQIAPDGGSPRVHTVMAAGDGAVIGETGAAAATDQPGDAVVSIAKSSRFGMKVTSSMSRASLAARRADLRLSGVLAGAAALALIGALFAFVRWRRRDSPLAELRRALKADQFVPYYQPILDISNGRLEGAEVLIRWQKPDGTIIAPADFIPLLESSGLIFDATRALMRRVAREAGAAIGRRSRCKISFNLTARHFVQESTVSEIRDIFAGSPIALSQLVLEVTERQPLENLAAARGVIAGLQELGMRVAIDDVGAGHGGLSYLLKLGVDILKIDKLFVDAIGTERHSAAIINSLVELARTMRMDIVAEGVESFEQVAYLRDQGIRLAQGYVFAPPLPGSSFVQLLEAAEPIATLPAATVRAAVPHHVSPRNRVAVA